ncbi:hypothetical protein NX059_004758 [Plenodomus lindquistii]|nr:hypothetical protein NX059_004758 [Plenodomus lindquistii]
MFLNQLMESTSYRNSNISFEQYKDPRTTDSGKILHLWSSEAIRRAMDALNGDPTTDSYGIDLTFAEGTADETRFYQVVDLRKAVAVNEGRVVFRDGKWIENPFLWDVSTPTGSDALSDEDSSDEADSQEISETGSDEVDETEVE